MKPLFFPFLKAGKVSTCDQAHSCQIWHRRVNPDLKIPKEFLLFFYLTGFKTMFSFFSLGN